MKIVVPMAGRGSRFSAQGVHLPKPLVPIKGRPMLAWALQSLKHVSYTEIIFVALAEHEAQYGISAQLRSLVDAPVRILLLEGVTEGQLCTVIAARSMINTDEDLLIASSDTYVVSSLARDIQGRAADCHGIISVANVPGDRWSFARTDSTGRVIEVAEKTRISEHASTGLYYFSRGHEFLEVAQEMIRSGATTRGEYYVIPVYQKYIDRGWRVDISQASQMWDMGTPEAAEKFEHQIP